MSKNKRRTNVPHAQSQPSTPFPEEAPIEGAGSRRTRLEHILLTELQSLVHDEATDPALSGIALLAVQLSPDAGHARIAYAVRAPLSLEAVARHSTGAGLARATGFLRARLSQQLDLKRLPRLTFTFVGVIDASAPCLA